MIEYKQIFPHTIGIVDYPNFHEIQDSIKQEIKSNLGIDYPSNTGVDQYDKVHDHPCRGGDYGIMYDVINFEKPDSPDNIKNPELKKLHDWLEEQCKDYWNQLTYNQHLHPYVLQMWGVWQEPGGFTTSHNHAGIPIAASFYVDAENKGNFVLEDPAELVLSRAPYNKSKGTPKRFHQEIEVKDGRLVMFPGWMKHFSRSNNSDTERVLMAINYGCHGQVYYTDWG
jgi:uncharacterized protein (TIGR02466 family)